MGRYNPKYNIFKSKNEEQRPVKNGNADDAAFLMKNASSVIIVPDMVWQWRKPNMH